MRISGEKRIHALFTWSLSFKGLYAGVEVLAGLILFFINAGFIYHAVQAMTSVEFAEDPHDFIAAYLLTSAQTLTVGSKTFIALYLLLHGMVKLLLVLALLKNKLWAYPVSLGVFALFIAYQLYRFSHTHSPFLLVLSVFDALVIWLVWHEYMKVRNL